MKTYIIGDIHGCRKALVDLLNNLELDSDHDVVIFLGDYIDRGPDSKGVIDEVLSLRKRVRSVISLMGNHEQVFLGYLAGHDPYSYLEIGGLQTLRSYGVVEQRPLPPHCQIPQEHIVFFHGLLDYWDDASHIFVHAGLKSGVHLSQQTSEWLFWARDEFLERKCKFNKTVVYGHTPFIDPKVEEGRIGIDTGVVYGGRLTCLILPDMEFVFSQEPELSFAENKFFR